MGITLRNNIWWIRFQHGGQLIWESTKTSDKKQAQRFEEELRREMREGLYGVDTRKERGRLLKLAAEDYLERYKLKHSAWKHLPPIIEDFNRHFRENGRADRQPCD